jgi:hypothetical protein
MARSGSKFELTDAEEELRHGDLRGKTPIRL